MNKLSWARPKGQQHWLFLCIRILEVSEARTRIKFSSIWKFFFHFSMIQSIFSLVGKSRKILKLFKKLILEIFDIHPAIFLWKRRFLRLLPYSLSPKHCSLSAYMLPWYQPSQLTALCSPSARKVACSQIFLFHEFLKFKYMLSL